MGNSPKFSKPQTIWNCYNLGWNCRVLTLDLRLRTLGSEDPKVPKWSSKAQNIAWKSVNLSQIEISDYIQEMAQN